MRTFLTISLLLLAATGAAAGDGSETFDVLSADGVPIHGTIRGDGPVVVLVHGWSCDGTYWADQVADLARDHRVVTVDLAGHGRSGDGREAYTMAAFGADVAAVLQAVNARDAVLVGHSMGGAVIVEAALAAPDRVRGLIGVDNFQNPDLTLTEPQIAGFLAAFSGNFTAVVPQWVGQMFPADADSALRATIAADMAAAPPAVALSAMDELLHWYGGEAPARLKALTVPLMNINAQMEPTREDAMRALVPAYQVRYLPGTGHFLFREQPEKFNALLRETLAELEG